MGHGSHRRGFQALELGVLQCPGPSAQGVDYADGRGAGHCGVAAASAASSRTGALSSSPGNPR